MTPFEEWQRNNYGDILPEYDNPLVPINEEIENGEMEREENERWMEREAEEWFNEQNF